MAFHSNCQCFTIKSVRAPPRIHLHTEQETATLHTALYSHSKLNAPSRFGALLISIDSIESRSHNASLPAPQLPLAAFPRSINCRSNREAPSYSRTATASAQGNMADTGSSLNSSTDTDTAVASHPMHNSIPLFAAPMPQQAVASGAITAASSTAETKYDRSEDGGGETDGVAEAARKVVNGYCGKCRQTVAHYENLFRCTFCYRD